MEIITLFSYNTQHKIWLLSFFFPCIKLIRLWIKENLEDKYKEHVARFFLCKRNKSTHFALWIHLFRKPFFSSSKKKIFLSPSVSVVLNWWEFDLLPPNQGHFLIITTGWGWQLVDKVWGGCWKSYNAQNNLPQQLIKQPKMSVEPWLRILFYMSQPFIPKEGIAVSMKTRDSGVWHS